MRSVSVPRESSARARQATQFRKRGAFCDVRRNVTGERHAGLAMYWTSIPKVQQQGIVIVDSAFSGKIVHFLPSIPWPSLFWES